MKQYLRLLGCIIACELVGIIGSVFTISAIPTWYAFLNKPSFAPPNWLFGPVWTVLYALMGISFFMLWQKGLQKKKVREAAQLFAAQLALNFIWTPVFFGLKMPELALCVIVPMWALIGLTIVKSYPISRPAAYLLIPYLLWVSFACLLNAGIAVLN